MVAFEQLEHFEPAENLPLRDSHLTRHVTQCGRSANDEAAKHTSRHLKVYAGQALHSSTLCDVEPEKGKHKNRDSMR